MNHDIFAKKAMNALERRAVMEILPYLCFISPSVYALPFCRVLVTRLELVALQDANSLLEREIDRMAQLETIYMREMKAFYLTLTPALKKAFGGVTYPKFGNIQEYSRQWKMIGRTKQLDTGAGEHANVAIASGRII